MYKGILSDSNFYVLLFKYDEDKANELHRTRCENCGGTLDWANYPRQPRGGPSDLEDRLKVRFSLCCRAEGCRKRIMPLSIRFLGRRIYFSAIFSLVVALSQGARPQKIAQISKAFDISRQTFLRWRGWWKEVFPGTRFWQREKSILSALEGEAEYPHTLVNLFNRFQKGEEALRKYLSFISPLDSHK